MSQTVTKSPQRRRPAVHMAAATALVWVTSGCIDGSAPDTAQPERSALSEGRGTPHVEEDFVPPPRIPDPPPVEVSPGEPSRRLDDAQRREQLLDLALTDVIARLPADAAAVVQGTIPAGASLSATPPGETGFPEPVSFEFEVNSVLRANVTVPDDIRIVQALHGGQAPSDGFLRPRPGGSYLLLLESVGEGQWRLAGRGVRGGSWFEILPDGLARSGWGNVVRTSDLLGSI